MNTVDKVMFVFCLLLLLGFVVAIWAWEKHENRLDREQAARLKRQWDAQTERIDRELRGLMDESLRRIERHRNNDTGGTP
jgi:uncharacterized iron-regulated membrane protein